MASRECVVCSEPYKTPKVLPCGHSFCVRCLRKWAVKSAENGAGVGSTGSGGFSSRFSSRRDHAAGGRGEPSVLRCPVCRHDCLIPSEGVSGFPTNIALAGSNESMDKEHEEICGNCDESRRVVAKCAVCREWLCQECRDLHRRVKVTRSHRLLTPDEAIAAEYSDSLPRDSNTCEDHPQMELQFYCKSCSRAICVECMMSREHRRHDRVTLDEIVETIQYGLETDMDSSYMARYAENIDKTWENIEKDKQTNTKDTWNAIEVRRHRLKSVVDEYAHQLQTVLKADDEKCKTSTEEVKDTIREAAVKLKNAQDEIKKWLAEASTQTKFSQEAEVKEKLQKLPLPPSWMGLSWNRFNFNVPDGSVTDEVTRLFGEMEMSPVFTVPKPVLFNFFKARTETDRRACRIVDMDFDENSQLVVCDMANEKLKVFNEDGVVIKEIRTPGQPTHVSRIPGDLDSVAFIDWEEYKGRALKWNIRTNEITEFATVLKAGRSLINPVALTVARESSASMEPIIMFFSSLSLRAFNSKGEEVSSYLTRQMSPVKYITGHPSRLAIVFCCNWRNLTYEGRDGYKWPEDRSAISSPAGVVMTSTGHLIMADRAKDQISLISPAGELAALLTAEDGIQEPRAVAYNHQNRIMAIGEEHTGIIRLAYF